MKLKEAVKNMYEHRCHKEPTSMIGWNAEYDDLSSKEIKECLKMKEVLKKRDELVEALMKFGVDEHIDDLRDYLKDVDDLDTVKGAIEDRASDLLDCARELESSLTYSVFDDDFEPFDAVENMVNEREKELYDMLNDYEVLLLGND